MKRALPAVGNMLSHIIDPYQDQVLLISDAVWCQEAEMTGAISNTSPGAAPDQTTYCSYLGGQESHAGSG